MPPKRARIKRRKGNAHAERVTPRNATETGNNATPRAALVAALMGTTGNGTRAGLLRPYSNAPRLSETPTERRHAAKIKPPPLL